MLTALGRVKSGMVIQQEACCGESANGNLVEILRWRAKHQGESIAFRFLPDGESEGCVMTYAQLHSKVHALANRLKSAGLVGERAILLYSTGPQALTSVLACLAAGVVAVPLSPPRPRRSDLAWERIASNCRARLALTTSDTRWACGGAVSQLLDRLGIPVLETDSAVETGVIDDRTNLTPDSVAYLQYTSGSTCCPKGVVITHSNLSHNCRALADVIDLEQPHLGVGWLPYDHDMGLVGTMFLPLWMGFPIVFMPPEAFLMKPIRWLRAISRYGGTISPAPNFAFDLCTQRVSEDEIRELNLNSWQIAFNGAERVDPSSLRRFTARFQSCGFRPETFVPCYGLAESTLFVAGHQPQSPSFVARFDRSALAAGKAVLAEEGIDLVSCGRPHESSDIQIVDPETRERCRSGMIGEIWVSGPSVATGYWNEPEASKLVFHGELNDNDSRRYLRTGDLGFIWEGELFITGRLKDLIITAGRNIAAEDIEASVESAHPAIREHGVVAFSIECDSRERLIVVAEVKDRMINLREQQSIINAIRNRVSLDTDLAIHQVILVQKHAVPRTPNGKKRRLYCRERFLQGDIRGQLNG